MPRLLVLQPYRAAGVRYQPGQVVEVSDAEAATHLADSPQWFELATEPELLDAPAAPPDKMIRTAPVRKAKSPVEPALPPAEEPTP